jgi:quercetin dioxygenase-like cupin family protein
MNKFRSLSLVATGAALALVPLLLAAQGEKGEKGEKLGKPAQGEKAEKPAKAQPTKITGKTLIAADELKWEPLAGIEGAMQSPVFGDPTKEAHRVFYKFPVGMKAPLHTHTNGDRGVIISGTLALAVEGAAAKKLPPGSYFSLAGGTKHVTTVEGDAPCVFYVEREGPFDVVKVEEAGAKKTK